VDRLKGVSPTPVSAGGSSYCGSVQQASCNNVADASSSFTRQLGECKWYNRSKGFGFIAPKNGGSDVFVHHSQVKDNNIMNGDILEFQIQMFNGRPSACKVLKVAMHQDPPKKFEECGLVSSDSTLVGTCKWFNKTFGFISPADGSQDIFVHISQVTNGIKVGDKVKFQLASIKDRMVATNVINVNDQPSQPTKELNEQMVIEGRLRQNNNNTSSLKRGEENQMKLTIVPSSNQNMAEDKTMHLPKSSLQVKPPNQFPRVAGPVLHPENTYTTTSDRSPSVPDSVHETTDRNKKRNQSRRQRRQLRQEKLAQEGGVPNNPCARCNEMGHVSLSCKKPCSHCNGSGHPEFWCDSSGNGSGSNRQQVH
jgi:CspA family cold shock protein